MKLFLIIGACFLSFIIVLLTIPPILRVARAKKLFEPFNKRKIHTNNVPSLGGIAIFIGLVLSTIIASDGYSFDGLKYIIASVILIFFMGLKDDLIMISVKNKIIVQIFATLMIITLGNVRITHFHGIFGIEEINYVTSILITLFTMVVIINAYNLIDGIDGLASGLAILAATVFGAWFFLAGQVEFSIMSFALVGSLAAFSLYNVFGHKNKLFMGDSGSLVVGLIISALVIKFNEFNIVKTIPFAVEAAPAVSFAVIIVPLIDTLRVMTIRIINKKSPFSPDKNHIHHRMLELVPNHLKVTLIIVVANAFLIGIAILFNSIYFNVTFQFILIFILGILLSLIPSLLLKRVNINKDKRKIHHAVQLN